MKTRILTVILLSAGTLLAQRHTRKHTANESKPVKLVKASEQPPVGSEHAVEVYGPDRIVTANGIPDHDTGAFDHKRLLQ